MGLVQESNGCNMIMNVVDRLSKQRHYVSCQSDMKAKDLAHLFVHHIWKHHGLPDTIVSDQGTLFISEFWKCVQKILNTTSSLSTPYHLETDGQMEIINGFFEQYMRKYINFTQEDWETWLAMAEFSANNVMSESTGMSPFFANYGHHPQMSFGPP